MPLDFPTIEKNILKFWQENKIFEKLREKNKGKKPPVLPQNNNKSKILRSSDEGMNGKTELKINGNLNHNGSKTTVEIPKPDLSSKSNQK